MSTGTTILITLLIIAVLILVHEWGHFITARKIGIPVWEFSIGFGPKIYGRKKDGVEYSLRLIPLGGYVRMAGEEPGDANDPEGFNNRTPLEKMGVAFAGPFMNFVLALLIFVYIYSVVGIPRVSDQPIIGQVVVNTPAEKGGLQANDLVLQANNKDIKTWDEFTVAISSTPEGQPLNLTVERNKKVINLSIIPVKNETTGKPSIGVMSALAYDKQGIISAIKIGFQQTYELTVLLLSSLGILISGGASVNDLAGPVGITKLIGEAAQAGMVLLLSFTAFLSINLGVLNLLPIPALDGSRIVFALVEAIRRKPLEPEKEGFIHWLGFLFLIMLMVLVTYNDIVRLIKG
ncbi:MAG: RIP metalloprotease RseP [Syntrophomonadaceae bacterium]|nr:RIP metalloprotease RseP [Syntrophomonadaceae bacterium]NLX03316.1 RIP metalloprotease RseP [Syntrophomonadaceae bacterium]